MIRTALSALLAPALLLSLAACATAPKAGPAPDAVRITYWEGGCYYAATCTDERFTLQADGRFSFDASTRPPGAAPVVTRHSGVLTAQAFAAAREALAAARFEAMTLRMDTGAADWKPDFTPCMVHGPGVHITREDAAGGAREVYWNTGCRSAAMTAFTAALKSAMQADAMRPRGG
jgi:hypothetical protein